MHIPAWLFWCYANMLERLDAEEAMESIARHRMGAGLLKQNEHNQMAREIEFRARGRRVQRGARPRSIEELRKIAGVQIVEEKE